MINFFYCGDKERSRFGYRRYWSYGQDHGGYNNTDCDDCHDIFDRRELCFVTTENEYNNPDNITWTVKLCSPCLNVLIYDNDEHIFNKLKRR